MKRITYVVVLLVTACAGPCRAAIILQSFVTNIRFAKAEPELLPESEQFMLGIETRDYVTLLGLGEYSSDDVGKTFTFTKQTAEPGEWEAAIVALQGDPAGTRNAIPTFWLDLDRSIAQRSIAEVLPQFPTYNLHQVDVMPQYYRTGNDNGNTYRTASFTATFYWLIPEPTTWVLAIVMFAVCYSLRGRRGGGN